MKKRTAIFLSLLCSLNLSAGLKKVKTDLTYDNPNGWWWYQETYIDEETNKEEIVKFKMSPKEKMELDKENKQTELLKILISKQDENKKVNNEILKRLEYAFPNVTPITTTNKVTGEQCLTNSSSDCFVMPVIAEGQQVPVLKNFIRDPNPENSKEWLKWQATYFNHVGKVSHGLRFAYLKHGADAYPTSTDYTYGDSLINSQSENAKAHREAKVISSIKDNIALMLFVGKNKLFEEANKIHMQTHNWSRTFLNDLDKVFVFESNEDRDYFLNIIYKYYGDEKGEKSLTSFWDSAKVVVRPDLYKTYNIKMSPSAVLLYESEDKKKNISQTISVGSLAADTIRRQAINFLTYNEIFTPKEMAAETNWASPSKDIQKEIPTPNDSGIHEEYLDSTQKEVNKDEK